MQNSSDLERQLNGYGLTTAHILYRMPDFECLLQTYIWQDYDIAPDFPEMRKFLDYWQANLEGALHSVRYSHRALIGPSEWRRVDGEFMLN
ncbi:aspartate-semialdehyde dehydrogenase (plasmid) [Ensifer adhaerens]|uniref:usg protein n=1 Tax=Ensifer adhaerens TaxID=106592 RepID=UPI001CC0DB79|nr:aspartate-semialdehyde dehydrogenase [Ensifer adhaerens]MBZ7927270.1 aspartate-semialdehyde dehydrogenase [Ensifer adhaerens]UAX98287.1 aspartate-semialdehyde dehydrogenase [Ensifer adhaerens]UAY05669.1 aspartate-semialdehyde dehydrogenase [Ensifer adhaerens]UAY13047.1 aspartate-semialdehyde dehydrogenase [Ensifer adhaerens]